MYHALLYKIKGFAPKVLHILLLTKQEPEPETADIAQKVAFLHLKMTAPEASFLNGFLRLRSELTPTQQWHSTELVPTSELASTLVLKNCPLALHRTWK
jgi:hypothetical protein